MVFLFIGLRIVLGGVSQGFAKSVVDTLPRAKALFFQYCIVVCTIWIGGLLFRQIHFEPILFFVLGIGIIDAFGVYSRWQAYRFSLSKTTLMIPFEGVAAAFLAAVFLKEASLYKDPFVFIGVTFLFLAAFLLSRKKKEDHENVSFRWLFAVLAMIALFGTTTFALKYFAVSNVSPISFFSFWYIGALLGTVPLLWLERENVRNIIQPGTWKVVIVAIANMSAIGVQFLAFQLAPAAFVLPPIVFGGLALPLLIGWIVFREWKGISRFELMGFVIGIGGAVILAKTQF